MEHADQRCQTARFELLQLPLEIRRLVYYHYLFYDGTVSRISEYYVPANVAPEQWAPVNRSTMTTLSSTIITENLKSNINALPLLLCSHQIYHEAISVLYDDATFYFEDMAVLQKFLYRRREMGNEHLIRSTYFNWTSFVWLNHGEQPAVQQYLDEYWYPLCQRLNEMNNLRSLVVAINLGKEKAAKRNFGKSDANQLLTWLRGLNTSLTILKDEVVVQ